MSSIAYLGRGGGRPIRLSLADGCSVAPSRAPGAWLEESLTPFAAGGLHLFHVVPPGFERYARILHPAVDAEGSVVRWSEVAELTGRSMHPEVQWEPLLEGPRGGVPDDLVSPWHSGTHHAVTLTLKRILVDGSDRDVYWMAVWSGNAGVEEGFPAPRISIGHRDFLLFRASSERVNDGMFLPFSGPLPGMWWPDDRSYCVSKDVDVCWTYVGGSARLIERLLESPELEALEVGPEHRGDYTSARINGPVRPTRR